jgi:hypothetical protein
MALFSMKERLMLSHDSPDHAWMLTGRAKTDADKNIPHHKNLLNAVDNFMVSSLFLMVFS